MYVSVPTVQATPACNKSTRLWRRCLLVARLVASRLRGNRKC